jgi:3-deoxy-D-manno-octulosonate 8-phosphate phosphatase (KDO 8-P phosphatase)
MTAADQSLFTEVKMLLLDVDGVLTDGAISYTGAELETKTFNVKDGLGIRMLINSGIHVAIVTGRTSAALLRRSQELGIALVYEGVGDKAGLLDEILTATGLASSGEVAFIGDDLPDIPLLKKVGLPIAVADAHPEVRRAARIVTSAGGGRGAVREVCELILKARGLWHRATAAYL